MITLQVEQAALRLPEQDRLRLAYSLFESVFGREKEFPKTTKPTLPQSNETVEWELTQLDQFSDAELWSVATMTALESDEQTMQAILAKQNSEGLTEIEENLASKLSQKFNRIMLMRAKASLLLKQRGHDVVTPVILPEKKRRPIFGSGKGLFEMKDSFDDLLEGFEPAPKKKRRPIAGSGKGLFEMKDNFDDPIEGFEPYL